MWTIVRRLCILLAVLCPNAPAAASEASAGYIVGFNPSDDGSGILVFSTTGARSARPACATLDRWVVSTNTNSGQFMAAALLTAYTMHKRISITGYGTCSVWFDTETVHYFVLED